MYYISLICIRENILLKKIYIYTHTHIRNERDVVSEFRNSRSAILVATDVAARGLGKNLHTWI